MYRRIGSGPFLAATTAGIVIVMAIFTWIMYEMALRVFILTDGMIEMNQYMKSMVTYMESMSSDVHSMAINVERMSSSIVALNENIGSMNANLGSMDGSVSIMAQSMPAITGSLNDMSINMYRMTNDIGLAIYAFTQPMEYMWGGMLPMQ